MSFAGSSISRGRKRRKKPTASGGGKGKKVNSSGGFVENFSEILSNPLYTAGLSAAATAGLMLFLRPSTPAGAVGDTDLALQTNFNNLQKLHTQLQSQAKELKSALENSIEVKDKLEKEKAELLSLLRSQQERISVLEMNLERIQSDLRTPPPSDEVQQVSTSTDVPTPTGVDEFELAMRGDISNNLPVFEDVSESKNKEEEDQFFRDTGFR